MKIGKFWNFCRIWGHFPLTKLQLPLQRRLLDNEFVPSRLFLTFYDTKLIGSSTKTA